MAKQAHCRVIEAEHDGKHFIGYTQSEFVEWLADNNLLYGDSGIVVRKEVLEAIEAGKKYVVIPADEHSDITVSFDYATKHTVAEYKTWMLGNDKPSKNYPYWMNERIIRGIEQNVDCIHEDDRFVITDKQIDSLKNWVAKMKDTYLR